MVHLLEREQVVPRGRPEVFAFFADARNLERLTPASLRFTILTRGPILMRAGTVIDYRIKLSGLPLRWRTLIEVFAPEDRFVDVQTRGPYKTWRHLHEFHEVPGGTAIVDRVEYELPFGPLGDVVHAAIVRRRLDGIFGYRRATIEALFGKAG
jgi:ligand-binding SRPBCC domain-containing protein